MEIARHKETQLQPLFPLHSRGYISRSRIPLLPFDFPASCVHPRIHEAVRVPVGKGLKVDEPKLFTWTDLARTNNGSGIQSCIHRVYIHRAMAVDRRKARTLWNEIFFSFHSLSLFFLFGGERERDRESIESRLVGGELLMRPLMYAKYDWRRLKMKTKTWSIDVGDLIIENGLDWGGGFTGNIPDCFPPTGRKTRAIRGIEMFISFSPSKSRVHLTALNENYQQLLAIV